MKVTVILIVIDAFGTVIKGSAQVLEDIVPRNKIITYLFRRGEKLTKYRLY